MATDPFDDEMMRLSVGLKQLETEYNRYFTGSQNLPPVHLQRELTALVRHHIESASTYRTAQKFRLNSLVSRFQIQTEMWNRNVRNMEEGRPAMLNRRGSTIAPGPASRAAGGEREIFRTSITTSDAAPDNEHLRGIYSSYLGAVQASDTGSGAGLTYGRFYDQIRGRLDKIQERGGGGQVTCRIVVVDNRPVLKVRSES